MGIHNSHLRLVERRRIAKWREATMPVAEIADRLRQNASSLYPDPSRNPYDDKALPELNGYSALNGRDMYERRCAVHRKMVLNPDLKASSEDRDKAGWLPEQIADRMCLERHPIRVSHETIHRFDGQFCRHQPDNRRRRARHVHIDAISGPYP